MFYEQDIVDLRGKVKLYMSEHRYIHTIGVENAAIRIGNVIMPDRVNELRVAALLHDIAKELPNAELTLLIDKELQGLTEVDMDTFAALHSFAAPALIKRDFEHYATDSVLEAAFTHTLGSDTMDLFSEVIFVSDFVEENRTYIGCRKTAEYLFGSLSPDKACEENVYVLHTAALMCIDHTARSLSQRGLTMNPRSIDAFDMLSKSIIAN